MILSYSWIVRLIFHTAPQLSKMCYCMSSAACGIVAAAVCVCYGFAKMLPYRFHMSPAHGTATAVTNIYCQLQLEKCQHVACSFLPKSMQQLGLTKTNWVSFQALQRSTSNNTELVAVIEKLLACRRGRSAKPACSLQCQKGFCWMTLGTRSQMHHWPQVISSPCWLLLQQPPLT